MVTRDCTHLIDDDPVTRHTRAAVVGVSDAGYARARCRSFRLDTKSLRAMAEGQQGDIARV